MWAIQFTFNKLYCNKLKEKKNNNNKKKPVCQLQHSALEQCT